MTDGLFSFPVYIWDDEPRAVERKEHHHFTSTRKPSSLSSIAAFNLAYTSSERTTKSHTRSRHQYNDTSRIPFGLPQTRDASTT